LDIAGYHPENIALYWKNSGTIMDNYGITMVNYPFGCAPIWDVLKSPQSLLVYGMAVIGFTAIPPTTCWKQTGI
jgi:hypothetical protein